LPEAHNSLGALQNLAFALWQKGQLTDATSVLQKELASAKSACNEALIKEIEKSLENFTNRINLFNKVCINKSSLLSLTGNFIHFNRVYSTSCFLLKKC
jgi:hypothetical protein